MTGKSNLSRAVLVSLYAVLLVGFFAASFFTELRLWGISTWGYLPLWGRVLLLGIGAGFVPLALKAGSEEWGNSSPRKSAVILTVLGASVLAGVCFWLLRGQTHFLGDGYGNIKGLSSQVPMINARDFGEVWAHLSLARALGGNTAQNVLLSYQIISVGAGVLLLVMVSWTSLRLFQRLRDAVLFTLVIILSGQALLFFGYVENYSLFVLAVGSFTCVGLLAAKGKVARRTILIPLVCSIGFHVLGIVLVLPAAYLLLAGGSVERRIARSSRPAKVGMTLALLLVIAAALWFATERSLFLRIAVLSVTSTRFTVEGYTLFSVSHLADFGNLLLILVPGLLLVLVGLWQSPMKRLFALTEYRFLLILTVTVFASAFVFDPKLGMPRDWDLFSFTAMPLSTLFGFALLDERNRWAGRYTVLALASVLAALTGAARVTTQFVPSMALRQIEDYVGLDRTRSKGAMVILQTYYAGVRNHDGYTRWIREFQACPEESLIDQADSLIARNRLPEALSNLRQAVRLNPMMSAPYTYLSVIHLRMGRTDEARAALDTALALSPGNPQALVGKGFFLQKDGNLAEAERLYIRATEMAPDKSLSYFYLARLRQTLGDTVQYIRYMEVATTKSDAAPELHIELCNVYISKGRYREAAEVLRKGMEKGLSRQAVGDLLKSHPELRMYLSL